MRSPLEKERSLYEPRLPEQLKEIEKLQVIDGEATTSVSDQKEIDLLFPKTYGQSVVTFQKGFSSIQHPALKVGVVLSGGQAPGGHNVITGLFDALKRFNAESRLFGFLNGPGGIVDNHYSELEKAALFPYRNMGGFDLLSSGRTKIESEKQKAASLENVNALGLDGLVIIGGDDSNTNAAILAEYFLEKGSKTKVIGVPKTIDGDLKNEHIETPFGFDTACKTYAQLIGNIARDALSAKKYTHFIKLMGRSASHITLECALQTHPNITLIGEEIERKQLTLAEISHEIAEVICQRAANGKNYGVILIPEGLIEFVPEMKTLIQELNQLMATKNNDPVGSLSRESRKTFDFLPEAIAQQLLLDRDPHGNVQVSHISTEQLLIYTVKAELASRSDYSGSFTPVNHFFGYEGRAGFPSNFDANYCYGLGFVAAALINSGHTGYMCALTNLTQSPEQWKARGFPITMMLCLEERKGEQKPVIQKGLVNLEGEPFKELASHRKAWSIEDDYRSPGPIQFAGSPSICDATTLTLAREQATHTGSLI